MFGSTFKPFTAAAAIQQGYFPDTTSYNVQKTMNWQGQSFRGCGNSQFIFPNSYATTNAVPGHDQGNFNMVTGMMWSVNNYWVKLEQAVGPCQAADMAERVGAQLGNPAEDINNDGKPDQLTDYGTFPSFTLGGPAVTPLSMAVAYGTFANRGVRCNPIILASVRSSSGVDMPVPSADCQQTIDPKVADGVNYLLQQTQTSGLSSNMYINNGIAQASKTGTADQSQSASAFVGYTPDLSTAVLVAGDTTIPQWQSTPPQSRNVLTLPLAPLGGRGLGSYGAGHAGVIWKPFMQTEMQNMPKSQFTPWVAPTSSSGQPSSTPTAQTTR